MKSTSLAGKVIRSLSGDLWSETGQNGLVNWRHTRSGELGLAKLPPLDRGGVNKTKAINYA